MKKYIIIATALIIGASLLIPWRKGDASLIETVDFDTSLNTHTMDHPFEEQWSWPVYKILKDVYEKNRPSVLQYHQTPLIPKKIHQIWLGSKLPEEYRLYGETWKTYHPEWTYQLWTDEDLDAYPMINRDLYEAAINYGEKADIARYEILYNEGGVYVDTDYECLRPLDPFNHYYTFYTGIQPLDTNNVQLGIGLIGAAAHHTIIRAAIDNLRVSSSQTQQIIAKTGPLYFTRIFCLVAPQLTEPVIALPPTYFYPRGYYQSKEEQNIWQKPESYAVHHWAGSWLKKEGFVPKTLV